MDKIECTLTNIYTGGELQYFFEVLPRVGDSIMIDSWDLRDDEEWQEFAGFDEDDPGFSRMRTYQVCCVNHWISRYDKTSIEILLDEFFGEEPT